MDVQISTRVLDAIKTHAVAESATEICGLLLGGEGVVSAYSPARNVAPDPRRAFEIDPAALLLAHRVQRKGGARIVGCYHSHPNGSATPSVRDAGDADPNGWLWLIVANGAAQLWRAVPDGAVHRRFDPVPFTCASAPPTSESALSP